ncbi:GrrA/OscA1 family cyclophane-containing rSAM-modified RiPP [Synechococcus sp. RS9916]|uniref:GrrA/OscA1 family cyclophane-containing rSAM-modified RiPP n=1 Tax=Synechococcus sp. RS9916 TaxID=221359 RepID=UPI0009041061|nr:GrrA/OscA1 family cyclophane-containing rSAM-modified RiPP [Synechococcus sp. RS9916]
MNKTTLLTVAAALAASSVLCESSRAAVHRQPDGANALEQRIERLNPEAWAALDPALPQAPDLLARAWGNGGGRAWGNGRGRGFANGGGRRGFGNAYRGGFANW